MKIVKLIPIADVTHRTHLLKRFICEDKEGVKYIAISLFGRVPYKGVFYAQSRGVPKVFTL